MLFQNFRETRKRWILPTTPSHCILMADSVQWLSQSDYSICISILVEFYKYKISVRRILLIKNISKIFNFQLTFTVSPTCFKKVVRADAIAELKKIIIQWLS